MLLHMYNLAGQALLLAAGKTPKVKVEGVPDQVVTTIRQLVVVAIVSFVVFQLFGMGRAVLRKPLSALSIAFEAAMLVLILFAGYAMGTDSQLNKGNLLSSATIAPFILVRTLWRVVFA